MVEKPWPDAPTTGADRPVRSIRPQPADPRPPLQDAVSVVWAHRMSILAITAVVVALALFISSRQTPVYESRVEVLVRSVPDVGTGEVTPRDPNLATEAELVTSGVVGQIVADDLGFGGSVGGLLNGVTVHRPTDTEILEIAYRHHDPAQAQRRAQAFAEAYLAYREGAVTDEVTSATDAIDEELRVLRARLTDVQRELASLDETDPRIATLDSETSLIQDQILQRQLARLQLAQATVQVGEIVQPASTPASPVTPNHAVNAGFGLMAGLALGVGLAFLRDRMSGRIRTTAEIEEHIGAPVLGAIPKVPSWRRSRDPYLVSVRRWQSPAAEAYRTLRTNVLSSATAHGARTLVVTSARDGEGKSATVANLGVVLARAGKQVTLVSADLRRPRLHQFFGMDASDGLAEVLAGKVPLNHALHEVSLATSPWGQLVSVRLRVLPSGHVPEDPAELLSSKGTERLLGDLTGTSDVVLVDAPPVLAVGDALVLAGVADGVLFVIGPQSASRSVLASARQQLDNVGANVVGAVLSEPDPSMTTSRFAY